MRTITKAAFSCVAMLAAAAALAQPGLMAPPMNVLQLAADGSVEVQQDLLSMTLRANKNGTDATAVQTELKQALDSALAAVRPDAKAGQMDVRTGNFNLHPRYTRDGAMSGWEGNAELVLQGRDFPRVAQAAGRVNTLTVSNISFALSPEASNKAETEAQALAIAAFKKKADELAKGFGFSGYTLREVSVNQGSTMPKVMAMRAPMAASAGADAPVPVEPGKTNVVVNVNGSVQLK